MKKYEFSRQRGNKNHCFCAQVWKPNGDSLCTIDSTEDENEASNTAELICKLLNKDLKSKQNMKNLTENQKEFLLEHFFKNESYDGWKRIAISLLDTGECVVTGNECIWIGGIIGNFIKTVDVAGYYGCLKYVFDLDYFLTSEYFKQITNNYLDKLKVSLNEVKLLIK